MCQSILVDKDLSVEISKLIQISTPGIFDDCKLPEQQYVIAKAFSQLLKNDFHINNVHVINSPISKKENIIACIMTASCSKPFKEYDGFSYELNILWFQNNYAFPINAEILEKMAEIPFRNIALKDSNPF